MADIRKYLDILNEVDENESSGPTKIFVGGRDTNTAFGLMGMNPGDYNKQDSKKIHEDALEVLAKYEQYMIAGSSTVQQLQDKQYRFSGTFVDELEAAKKRAEARRDDPAAAELQDTVYGYVHFAETAKPWNGEPPVESKELDEMLTVMFGEQYYFMSKEDIAKRLEQEKSIFKSIELTNSPMSDDMQVQKEIVDRLDRTVSDNSQRLVWSNIGKELDSALGSSDSEASSGSNDPVAPGRTTTDDGTPNDTGQDPVTSSPGAGTAPYRPDVDVDADQDFDGNVEDFGPGTGGSGRGDGSSEADRRNDDSKPAPYRPDVDVDADQDFDGDAQDFGPGTGGSGRGDGSSEADRRDNDSRPAPFQQDFDVDADQDFDGDAQDFGPGTGGSGRGDGSSEADRRNDDASDDTGVAGGTGTAPSYNVDADQDFYGDADGFGPGTGGTGRGSGSSEMSRRAADSATGTGRGSGSAETGRRAADSKPNNTVPATAAAQPKYDVERVLQRSGTTTNMNVSKYRNKSPYVISNFSGGKGRVGKIYGKQQNLAKFFPGKTIYTEAATVDLKDHINKL